MPDEPPYSLAVVRRFVLLARGFMVLGSVGVFRLVSEVVYQRGLGAEYPMLLLNDLALSMALLIAGEGMARKSRRAIQAAAVLGGGMASFGAYWIFVQLILRGGRIVEVGLYFMLHHSSRILFYAPLLVLLPLMLRSLLQLSDILSTRERCYPTRKELRPVLAAGPILGALLAALACWPRP